MPTDAIRAIYDRSFRLAYEVTLGEHELRTDLAVTNTSGESLEFQALLHNYIRAPADEVLVTPLEGKTYYDKTEGTEGAKRETRAGVDVRGYTDAVYEEAGGTYVVGWGGGGVRVVGEGLKDVVVWNPQGPVGDLEEQGWCVGCGLGCGGADRATGRGSCALSRGT